MKPILFSTNPYLKFYIHKNYRNDVHYVWCSEYFDGTNHGAYSPGAHIPPTSNPRDIYLALRGAVDRTDAHDYKINEQKVSLKKLANEWFAAGEIPIDIKNEIIYQVDHAPFSFWRPIIYVIPSITVSARLKLVPPAMRAGIGPEYIIEDLNANEFDIVEV